MLRDSPRQDVLHESTELNAENGVRRDGLSWGCGRYTIDLEETNLSPFCTGYSNYIYLFLEAWNQTCTMISYTLTKYILISHVLRLRWMAVEVCYIYMYICGRVFFFSFFSSFQMTLIVCFVCCFSNFCQDYI